MRINGQTIRTPTELKLGIYRLSKADRTSDGTMVMEIVAIKRRLDLKWTIISESDLRSILDNLESRTFHTVEYPDPQGTGGTATMTAYTGDINQSAWRRVGDTRYWRDVTLALIEQ